MLPFSFRLHFSGGCFATGRKTSAFNKLPGCSQVTGIFLLQLARSIQALDWKSPPFPTDSQKTIELQLSPAPTCNRLAWGGVGGGRKTWLSLEEAFAVRLALGLFKGR